MYKSLLFWPRHKKTTTFLKPAWQAFERGEFQIGKSTARDRESPVQVPPCSKFPFTLTIPVILLALHPASLMHKNP